MTSLSSSPEEDKIKLDSNIFTLLFLMYKLFQHQKKRKQKEARKPSGRSSNVKDAKITELLRNPPDIRHFETIISCIIENKLYATGWKAALDLEALKKLGVTGDFFFNFQKIEPFCDESHVKN